MTKQLKEQLKKRLYSFLWRLGAYVVVSGSALMVNSLDLLNINPSTVAVIALLVGEITKYVNTYTVDK